MLAGPVERECAPGALKHSGGATDMGGVFDNPSWILEGAFSQRR